MAPQTPYLPIHRLERWTALYMWPQVYPPSLGLQLQGVQLLFHVIIIGKICESPLLIAKVLNKFLLTVLLYSKNVTFYVYLRLGLDHTKYLILTNVYRITWMEISMYMRNQACCILNQIIWVDRLVVLLLYVNQIVTSLIVNLLFPVTELLLYAFPTKIGNHFK